jgi:GAF domain-containing protein
MSGLAAMRTDGERMAREELLAQTLVELADNLVDDFDVVELLTLLATRCVEVLDVSTAGLMLVAPDGDPKVVASSSEAMRVLELFELQAQEGPCFDCLHSGEAVLDGDLDDASGRWPQFATEAREAGFHSASALPMRLRGTVIGALNLFRRDRGAMTQADAVVGQAFADVATIAIIQHRAAAESRLLNEQLTSALNSRIAIEQAKGILAERAGLDMTEAFGRLRSHARSHNLRLADVALAVIEGRLTDPALDAPA